MRPGRQDLNVNFFTFRSCRPLDGRQSTIFENFPIQHIFLKFYFFNIKMKKAQATNNQGPVYFLKSLGSWWQGQQEEEKWRYRSLICCVGRHCGHFCCSGLHYLQEPVVYWSQPHLIGPDLYMLTLDPHGPRFMSGPAEERSAQQTFRFRK